MENNCNKMKSNKLATGASLGVALGAGVGVAIGAATDNIGLWIAIGAGCGLALGAGIGNALENSKKKENNN
jgi:ABC-type Fe3+-siderophore transport system permease subunit